MKELEALLARMKEKEQLEKSPPPSPEEKAPDKPKSIRNLQLQLLDLQSMMGDSDIFDFATGRV